LEEKPDIYLILPTKEYLNAA